MVIFDNSISSCITPTCTQINYIIPKIHALHIWIINQNSFCALANGISIISVIFRHSRALSGRKRRQTRKHQAKKFSLKFFWEKINHLRCRMKQEKFLKPTEVYGLLKTSFKYQTKEFFNNSTLHGVRYIAEKGRSFGEKFMWFCFVSIGAVAAFVIIGSLWEKFQTNPTITGEVNGGALHNLWWRSSKLLYGKARWRGKWNFNSIFGWYFQAWIPTSIINKSSSPQSPSAPWTHITWKG